MQVNRRTVIQGLGAALSMPFIIPSARAQSVTSLRLHHFLPPVSTGHSKLLAPWAKKVETESQGRIKIDIFPSMQLGGTPPQLFDQAKDGVADIVWTLPGYTPNRFPRTEVLELPFIAGRSAVTNSLAAQELAETQLVEEYRDVKLLCLWAHDAGGIHANKQVRTLEDLKGLKLRNPTRLAGEALKALGAVSVGMPVPQVPESLAQRVIDGAVIPWEVVPAVKVHELVKFHTTIPGTPTLYTATFMLAMNRAKYDQLPKELQAVIDANSGMTLARNAGQVWDDQAKVVSQMVAARGNTITELAMSEKARWIAATNPVLTTWIEQLKSRNIDAVALHERAKALIAKHNVTT
ncbi:DctP TRAP-type C4-dicarboxylate transport system, periplasmic component [Rhabdaerophilaceae bacterium]